MQTGVAKVPATEGVLNQPADHPDSRCAKSNVPVHALPEIAAHQRRDEGAEVDAHVVDREARVATMILRSVETSHDDRGIALEEAGADHDECETQIERCERGKRHAEVAGRDHDSAIQHRTPLPNQAVGHPSTWQSTHVHHRRVQTVHGAGDGRVEAETPCGGGGGHEEDEQSAHPVITEALPHLGEEERRQPARMPEESVVVRWRSCRGRGADSHLATGYWNLVIE